MEKEKLIADQMKLPEIPLREQGTFVKVVQLKVGVGEKVYMPWSWERCNGIAELEVMRIVISKDKTRYFTKIESDSIAFLRKYRFGTFNESDFGKIVFTNLKAAQAAR